MCFLQKTISFVNLGRKHLNKIPITHIQEKNKSDDYVRNEYHPLVLEIFNNNNQKDLELYQIVCENFL